MLTTENGIIKISNSCFKKEQHNLVNCKMAEVALFFEVLLVPY